MKISSVIYRVLPRASLPPCDPDVWVCSLLLGPGLPTSQHQQVLHSPAVMANVWNFENVPGLSMLSNYKCLFNYMNK